jgi:PAS domain S-box-containing protein
MMSHNSDPAQWKNSAGVFCLLLLAVFATELAIMELFSPLFSRLGLIAGGLLDAGSMALFCAIPLWFYLFRLLPADPDGAAVTRPWGKMFRALGGIFVAEFLVMLLLPHLCSITDTLACDLVDAALTTSVCAVLFWRLLFRPEMRRRIVPMMDTPLRLYVLLLSSIFLSDLLQELLLPFRSARHLITPTYLVDAFLTTLFGAPLIWLLVARPLNRAARSDRARVAAVHTQVIDAIVVIDPKGIIDSFNPAAEKIFGYAAQDMLGQSAALLLEGGAGALGLLMNGTADPAAAPDPDAGTSGELICRRRDGLTLIMNISISAVLLGQRPEFLLIMRDITSRKRMEEALRESEMRFRQIFHQSEDAILFFKPGSCEVIDANAKAEKIFGYSKAELREWAFDGICATATPPELARAIGEITQGREVRQEFVCRNRDGAEIMISLRGKEMLLQGVPVTYCTFRDITERVLMEERTREIQARLIQTNKMTSLGLLVSGVAHEINNPNNFIMANCEILASITEDSLKALHEYVPEQDGTIYLGGIPLSDLGEHTKRLLGGIATGSRRVNDIVSNLKGFARQEHNQPACRVDVSQVARSAVSLMHHELIKYTDNFHQELAENLPVVSGHGQQLGQVIINLLMNACQALPGRDSGIWLTTCLDAGSGLVCISVRDEGHGMSRDDRQRVLEPFFTTKLDSGGTGLGLSISDSIVKEHGGTLEFTSEVGQGTTFVVRLPTVAPAEKEQL